MVYFLVSGLAFFVGAGLGLVGVGGNALCGNKFVRRWVRLATVGCAAMVALSTTPLPIWFYGIWLSVWLAWLIAEGPAAAQAARAVVPLRVVTILLCLGAVAVELPHHLTPEPTPGHFERLYVVGDSISAGLGGEKHPWPAVLADDHGVAVTNLAKSGATVETIRAEARRIPPGPALVLLEIGGNDLLGSTSPQDYAENLRALLSDVCVPGRAVVMLELPLIPFRPASYPYGRTQRRLAREFGLTLIPKRLFAAILLTPGATSDGLHLTDRGHKAMAEMIWRVVGRAMASSEAR